MIFSYFNRSHDYITIVSHDLCNYCAILLFFDFSGYNVSVESAILFIKGSISTFSNYRISYISFLFTNEPSTE